MNEITHSYNQFPHKLRNLLKGQIALSKHTGSYVMMAGNQFLQLNTGNMITISGIEYEDCLILPPGSKVSITTK